MSDNIKFYQLPLEMNMDKDIIDRLSLIPRSRKAEWVRTALRVYMNLENGQPQGLAPHIYLDGPSPAVLYPENKKMPKLKDFELDE